MESPTPTPAPRFETPLWRRLLRAAHPRKLWHRCVHLAHRLGYYRLRLWILGLDPRRIIATWRYFVGLRALQRRRRGESRLTVAVDVSPLWEPLTGIGWYLYRLLEQLAPRDDVLLRLYGPDVVDKGDVRPPTIALPEGPAIERVVYRVPENLSFVHYWLADRLRDRLDRLIAADGNRVLFAPNYFLPPWFERCAGALVATLHDLSVLKVPETMRESTRQNLSAQLERTARRASWVLTDSETVRGELIESGLVNAARVRAIHLGPGSVARTEPTPLPEPPGRPYLLHVGTLEPRKNLPVLLAAWRRLLDRGVEVPLLVLCGGYGWKSDALRRAVDAAQDEGWLRHYGYLADGEVAALYRGAEWVVMPSLYEGFGLPLVEAMSLGVPLLCSDIPVLREVAGEAALYAPPGDPEAWADQVERSGREPSLREELVRRGAERAGAFSWRATAGATLEVWRGAAGLDTGCEATPAGPHDVSSHAGMASTGAVAAESEMGDGVDHFNQTMGDRS